MFIFRAIGRQERLDAGFRGANPLIQYRRIALDPRPMVRWFTDSPRSAMISSIHTPGKSFRFSTARRHPPVAPYGLDSHTPREHI